MSLRRWLTVVLSALVVSAVLSPVTAAQRSVDPLEPGPHPTAVEGYQLGDSAFTVPGFPGPIEVTGAVHHPRDLRKGPYPVVVLVHGSHQLCDHSGAARLARDPRQPGASPADEGDPPGWPCAEGERPIPNFRGYDYLATVLASHGFVAVSVSSNGVEAAELVDGGPDDWRGMDARARLIDHHLRLWRQWSAPGSEAFGGRFRGALDLDRVATVGHSRGGEGVLYHARTQRGGGAYRLRALVQLAPTNMFRQPATGVPTATVLPYCDGDVNTLEGAHQYDDSRYLAEAEAAPRYLVTLGGANHNYFNTVWSPSSGAYHARDDWLGRPPAACAPGTATRLTEGQQRVAAVGLVTSFVRLHLAGVAGFGPLWTGRVPVPSALAPAGALVSYQAPARSRLDVNRFTAAESLTTNTAGGAVRATGFATAGLCGGTHRTANCLAKAGTDAIGNEPHRDLQGRPGLRFLRLTWSSPGARLVNELDSAADGRHHQAVRFRVAVDFTDPLNPVDRPQALRVVVRDAAGRSGSALVPAGSPALAYPPRFDNRDTARRFLFQQVRVPLAAFTGFAGSAGFDRARIRSVELVFDATASGAVGISDLSLGE